MGGSAGPQVIPVTPCGSKWKRTVDGPREPFIVRFDTETGCGVWHRELVSRSAGYLNTIIERGEELVLFPAQSPKIQFRIIVRNIEHPADISDAHFCYVTVARLRGRGFP